MYIYDHIIYLYVYKHIIYLGRQHQRPDLPIRDSTNWDIPIHTVFLPKSLESTLVGGWAYPSEKYENQLGWLYIYIPNSDGKIKNVPNHQPDDKSSLW